MFRILLTSRMLLLAGVLCSGAVGARDVSRMVLVNPPGLGTEGRSLLASRPLDPARVVERIAFGSCFKVQRNDNRVWDSIAATDPELFLFAGDTLYPEDENELAGLPGLREAYQQLADVEAFAALREQIPVLSVWDDHDYGMNDGGADFSRRAESESVFEGAWIGDAADPRRAREGIYHSVTLGPAGRRVQILLLDTRFFRSPLKVTDSRGAPGRERYVPDHDSSRTMLGDRQWHWLEEQLALPAELRLVVSSIQVVADGHGWEGWRQFPAEQERLFALLRAHNDAPLLVLSGDRHVAGFYERDIGLQRPLLEFTSSPLNNTIPFPYRRETLAEAGPYRVGELYGEANFGSLVIDWSANTLTLTLRDRDGEAVNEMRYPLSPELSPELSPGA